MFVCFEWLWDSALSCDSLYSSQGSADGTLLRTELGCSSSPKPENIAETTLSLSNQSDGNSVIFYTAYVTQRYDDTYSVSWSWVCSRINLPWGCYCWRKMSYPPELWVMAWETLKIWPLGVLTRCAAVFGGFDMFYFFSIGYTKFQLDANMASAFSIVVWSGGVMQKVTHVLTTDC